VRSITDFLTTNLARRLVVPSYARQFLKFQCSLANGRAIQRDNLLRWIRRCSSSRFGRDHQFRSIRTLEDYRQQVPIAGYDNFAPYINGVASGNHEDLLPPDERVTRFTITTGSTGIPKLNPVTPTWLRRYRQSWSLWGGKMLVDNMQVVGRKILHIIGSYDMGRTSGGIPISMVSALLARNQHPLVRPFYSVPNDVTDIPDPDSRYYATLRLSIADDIGLIVVMNPGTLLRLARFGDEQKESLIRDIRDGSLSSQFEIPAPILRQMESRIRRPNPKRAQELERIVESTGNLLPRDYWNRPLIACWLGGTAGYQAKYLADVFGDCPMRDQGLVSSEGRHTIPYQDGKPEGLLAIHNGFYEFIPVNEGGANPTALEGHELQIGTDYQIVMTTFSGYFRFRIGDVVRCRGMIGQTPVLEFLQKADRCGDLEGEKVTEFQFLAAALDAALEQGIRLGTVTAVPTRPDCSLPCYQILIEQGDVPSIEMARGFLHAIDARLRTTNFLYNARRRERVLGPPVLSRIPTGAWSRYVQTEIEQRGTGEAHYKHPALVQNPEILDRFDPVDQVEFTAI
jgi:hypothetical protein